MALLRHRAARLRPAFALGLALLAAVSSGVSAAGPGEYEVKGAFLYNFAKFVKWPEGAVGERFTLCLVGGQQIADQLTGVMDGRSVDGRPVAVSRRADGESGGCQILFVSGASGRAITEVSRSGPGSLVLTVGESRNFARDGGMINFLSIEKKVRFEINKRSAEDAGLSISSHLLKLAHDVYE